MGGTPAMALPIEWSGHHPMGLPLQLLRTPGVGLEADAIRRLSRRDATRVLSHDFNLPTRYGPRREMLVK